MHLYLTGADGMLGAALAVALRADSSTQDWEVLGVSLADHDIADAEAVAKAIDAFRPDIVVHAAAHAIVDDCEADPGLAMRVNVAGTHNVAEACRRNGSRLVYVSSDYVFDGVAPPAGGYRETDVPNPRNVYGLTKLAGERIAQTVPRHLIVRTSWLFGGADERTDTVLSTIRRTGRGEPVTLIDDQFSKPTYTHDLAAALVFLLARSVLGTIHVANHGTASWYQVARVALAGGRPTQPVALDDCDFLGTRPRDSSLNTDRLAVLGYRMPDWADAVARFGTRVRGSGP